MVRGSGGVAGDNTCAAVSVMGSGGGGGGGAGSNSMNMREWKARCKGECIHMKHVDSQLPRVMGFMSLVTV